MPSRASRRSVASKAAGNTSKAQLSSPPSTPKPVKNPSKAQPALTGSKKRKAPAAKAESLESPNLPTPSSTARHSDSPNESSVKAEADTGDTETTKPSTQSSKKRKRPVKKEEDEEKYELPHNVGEIPEVKEEQEDTNITTTSKQTPSKPKAPTTAQSAAQKAKDARDAERAVTQLQKVKAKYAEDVLKRSKALESGKKTKSETYGLSEGETPFPNWPHPTHEECQTVHDILSKHHPDCKPQPKTVPEPSKFVAGCGEVRSILDALIRTRLSASTTSRNSSTAYQGMVKRYGLTKEGVGKGSVDYTAVRDAPVQDLFHAIKGGGLAASKSADIMAILDIVYEENQARKDALLSSSSNPTEATTPGTGKNKGTNKRKAAGTQAPQGADVENKAMKQAEIQLAEQGNLSLDHYYTLPTYAAIYKFMTLPGIGVKTAACVAMFCMQRPCFAVDTHVFRLAKWLGWVPPDNDVGRVKGQKKVDRDTTFSHLEVKVPDQLKYMLHQLLIKHGKTCPRCRGATGEGGKGWGDGCVIERFVKRTGARKGGGGDTGNVESPVKKGNANKGKVEESEDEVMEGLDEVDEEDEDDDDHDGDGEDGAGDSEAEYTPRRALDEVATPASSARSRRGAAVSARKKLAEVESEDEDGVGEPRAKRRR